MQNQPESEPPHIKVINADDQDPVFFPVVPKEGVVGVYTLSLQFLQSIYPGATGLTAVKDGDKKAMLLRDGQIEVYDSKLTYETVIEKQSKSSPLQANSKDWKIQLANHAQRDRILDIKRKCQNTPVIEDKKTSEAMTNKKSKISDIRDSKGVILTTRTKAIEVGLKFKYENNEDDQYVQIRKDNGGGIIEISFEVGKIITVEQVIAAAIPKFSSAKAQHFLEHSTHKLGLTQNRADVVIEKFCDQKGKEIGLFEYFNLYDLFRQRKKLYLMCTAIESFWGETGKKSESEDEENQEIDKNLRDLDDHIKDNVNVENFGTVQDNNGQHQQTDENLDNMEAQSKKNKITQDFKMTEKVRDDDGQDLFKRPKDNSLSDITNKLKQRLKAGKSSKTLEKTGHDFGREILQHLEPSCNKNLSPQTAKPELLMKVDNETFSTMCSKISISFWIYGFSRYGSEQFFCYEGTKDQVYDHLIMQQQELHVDRENFDPLENGFHVSTIGINDYDIFKSSLDEPEKSNQIPKMSWSYPNLLERPHVLPHTILYDLDEVLESYEGKWTIGIVPHCYPSCSREFTWFKNNKLHTKEQSVFYISDIPITSEPSSWCCKIKCKNFPEPLISKTVELKIAGTLVQNRDSCVNGVLLVGKDQFSVEKKYSIGNGQQATVYKGFFGEQTVAVKTIKFYHTIPKDTLNEINVLKSINHPNFVSLKGICVDKKQIQLLLEYFDSISLADLLDDEDNCKDYQLHGNKVKIISQLTTAIKFLQHRDNPILHRDLKPDNILVNRNLQVKICDFGLSKFTMTKTNLRSTTARTDPVGTFVYSAPEILLQNEPATIASDVWSLAIIIVEIFKEDSAWEVETRDQLIDLMKVGKTPDLTSISDEQFHKIKKIMEE